MIPVVLRHLTARATVKLCVVAGLLLARPVLAQNEGVHTQAVLEGGLSLAGGEDPTSFGVGFAWVAGLKHQRDKLVLSGRAGMNYGGTAPTSVFGGLRDRYDEMAMMAGYAMEDGSGLQYVLSSGLAFVAGERIRKGPAPHYNLTTVPLKMQVGIPVQIAISGLGGGSGFGFTGHANFNPEEVFAALTATYLIGLGNHR